MTLEDEGRAYDSSPDREQRIRRIADARTMLAQFLEMYPFREIPAKIDELTPEALYSPGQGNNYFFLWPEKRLRDLGGIAVGSAQVYRNAATAIEDFKQLLRIAVDDNKSLAEKVDAPWEKIRGFGGEKQLAKKIISSYYLDDTFPGFKTDNLEGFCAKFGIDLQNRAQSAYRNAYEGLSLGEKYALLSGALLEEMRGHEVMADWDVVYFMYFLYDTIPWAKSPVTSARRPPQPLDAGGKLGLLWEPKTEQEVVVLFAKFHTDLGFPYILTVQQAFPDALVLDNDKQSRRVEFEVAASHFQSHGHDPKGCDFIVCWENDLEDGEIDGVEIIALKEALPSLGLL